MAGATLAIGSGDRCLVAELDGFVHLPYTYDMVRLRSDSPEDGLLPRSHRLVVLGCQSLM